MADNGPPPRQTLEEAKRRARHAIDQRTWASVARLGSQRRAEMFGKPKHAHPISNSATRRAFNARKSGWSGARSLALTAKPAGAHGMPICEISTPRLARLVSSFLGVDGMRPTIPLSALSSGSAHVPSSFASARAIGRGSPVQSRMLTAALGSPVHESAIGRLARAFGPSKAVGTARTQSMNRAKKLKTKSNSKSKRKARSA